MKKSVFAITLLINLILISISPLQAKTPAEVTPVPIPGQKIGHISWSAEDSILPSIYMTDGQKKVFADWGGVYPLKNIMNGSPEAYEEALKYQTSAGLVKWLSVGSLLFGVVAILGGMGDSDTLFTGGAAGLVISTGAAARYQAKAMYHLHRAVNIYNESLRSSPRMGLNFSTSF